MKACLLLLSILSVVAQAAHYSLAAPSVRVAPRVMVPQKQHSRRSTYNTAADITAVQDCNNVAKTLARGALLRIASDLSGGTAFESWKTRVTVYPEGPLEGLRSILDHGGVKALWTGTPSRTLEGALVGALFMAGSVATKSRLQAMGCGPTVTALTAGLVGGVAQALVMTPAGMIFTSLGYRRGQKGYEKENAWTVTKRVVSEQGVLGMYRGFQPMALRQASNWASRAGFTEVARSVLGWSKYGIWGELASGCLGGLGSCWNTPIETIRVITQRDVGAGRPTKTMRGYWDAIVEEGGYPSLFRGITPRALQAIWQTTFLVVVPNLLGL